MLEVAKNVALLAPVPEEHLIDGAAVAQAQGRVAFGSNAWELFRELDRLRRGLPVDVYIYASHVHTPGPLAASWHGRYVGHVDSDGGAHPLGMQLRPPSTGKYFNDNSGYWGVFWEVEDLVRLPVHSFLAVADLTGYGKGRRYGHPFVPEGPLLIEHP